MSKPIKVITGTGKPLVVTHTHTWEGPTTLSVPCAKDFKAMGIELIAYKVEPPEPCKVTIKGKDGKTVTGTIVEWSSDKPLSLFNQQVIRNINSPLLDAATYVGETIPEPEQVAPHTIVYRGVGSLIPTTGDRPTSMTKEEYEQMLNDLDNE